MQLIDPCIIHSINILIQYFISIGKKVDKIKYAKKIVNNHLYVLIAKDHLGCNGKYNLQKQNLQDVANINKVINHSSFYYR